MAPADTTVDTNSDMNGENLSPAEIIAWHIEAGVDEAISEEPQNRFDKPSQPPAAPMAASQASAKAPVEPMVAQALIPPTKQDPGQDKALKTAVKVAASANTLDELHGALEKFDGCGLKATAENLVWGYGNSDAKLMLIGDVPGDEEDRQGVPFVGPGGQLLDKMLASIGLDREQVFLSYTVFWRPPGKRTPSPGEIALCQPFVERMIEIIDPELIVTIGAPATHSLLAQKGSIARLRGKWFSYESPKMSRPVQATAIYSPDYLLSSPAMKRPTWDDLLEIKKKYKSLK